MRGPRYVSVSEQRVFVLGSEDISIEDIERMCGSDLHQLVRGATLPREVVLIMRRKHHSVYQGRG